MTHIPNKEPTQVTIHKTRIHKLQKMAGYALVMQALIYISAFVFYDAFWHYPSDAADVEKLAFLQQNISTIIVADLLLYLLFGALLTIIVIAAHARFIHSTPYLIQFASVFGIIWVAFVFAAGMIDSIGIQAVVKQQDDPASAMALLKVVLTVVDSIGGGNEIVGGIWVSALSLAALKAKHFPRRLNYFGLLVGTAGILTTYPDDVITQVFGISQIIWFAWLGIYMVLEKEISA